MHICGGTYSLLSDTETVELQTEAEKKNGYSNQVPGKLTGEVLFIFIRLKPLLIAPPIGKSSKQ